MKTTTWILCFLGCIASDLYAQSSIVASGGNASGSGGIVNYTIGQINYTYKAGAGGSLSEGVQQPYEFIPAGINNVKGIDLITVYPNPSISSVKLRVENGNLANLSFQLYDVSGRLLVAQKVNGSETSLPMETLPAANYILKITDNNKEVQSFKIIKNK